MFLIGFMRLKRKIIIKKRKEKLRFRYFCVFCIYIHQHINSQLKIQRKEKTNNKSDLADQASFSSRTSTPLEFWTFCSSGRMDFSITFTSSATLSSALWRRLWKRNENQKKQLKLQSNTINQCTDPLIH